MSRAEPRTLLEQLIADAPYTWHEAEARFVEHARVSGEHVSVSWRQLQRIAAGEIARPRPAIARVLADLFGHPIGELLGPPRDMGLGTADITDVPSEANIQRRSFLAGVAAASLGAAAPDSFARLLDGIGNGLPQHVGMPEVVAVEAAAEAYMNFDLARCGNLAAELARGALNWSTELLKMDMTEPIRQRLSSAVGLLADRLGWSVYDSGRSDKASRMLVFALDSAARGADPDLRAHIMLDLSTVTTDAGYPADGVDILRAALGDERISSAERANLHAVCARHCASAGYRESGLRHASLAEEALAQSDLADGPDWARQITYGPGHHYSALGLALFALGDAVRSRQHLDSALTKLDQRRTRTALRCRIRLAILEMRDGNGAGGVTEGYRVISDVAGVTSRRVLSDLRMLQDQAVTHGATTLAADLAPLIA